MKQRRDIRGTVATRNEGVYVAGYSQRRRHPRCLSDHMDIEISSLSDSAEALKNFKDCIRAAHSR